MAVATADRWYRRARERRPGRTQGLPHPRDRSGQFVSYSQNSVSQIPDLCPVAVGLTHTLPRVCRRLHPIERRLSATALGGLINVEVEPARSWHRPQSRSRDQPGTITGQLSAAILKPRTRFQFAQFSKVICPERRESSALSCPRGDLCLINSVVVIPGQRRFLH